MPKDSDWYEEYQQRKRERETRVSSAAGDACRAFAVHNLTIAEVEEAIDIIRFRMSAIYQTTSFTDFPSTSSPVSSEAPSEETKPCDPEENP
jgi:hypothetical protein